MRIHNVAAGLLALVAFASVGSAQDTTRARQPRSERRIMVSKGEVVQAGKVDTVVNTVYRTDTVYVTRHDTVRVPKVIVRVDTFVPPVATPLPEVKGPFYLGFYGGMTAPITNFDRLYTNGIHLGGLVGFEGNSTLLGARLMGDINQLNREQGVATSAVGTKTPLLVNIGGELKLMPMAYTSWRPYAIAGGNLYTYRGIATVSKSGSGVTGIDGRGGWYEPAKSAKWTTKAGFNFGAGTDFILGKQEMFLEARVSALQANGAQTWFVPVSFGLRYF